MKKRLLTATLLFCILFSGCGNSGDTSLAIDDTDVWEDNIEYEETDADYEEDIYEEYVVFVK